MKNSNYSLNIKYKLKNYYSLIKLSIKKFSLLINNTNN